MAEEALQSATDGGATTTLFSLNPAFLRPDGVQVGALFLRTAKTASLDHIGQGGEKIQTTGSSDSVLAAALTDLGAGAGLGLSHQVQFIRNQTTVTPGREQIPLVENAKEQHSAVKLVIELMDELRAGVAIRYLYRDVQILGDPGLSDDESTRYKMTLVGYGSGFAYSFKQGGLSYTYFPPLRGKTEVEGEEKIVVEPGEIGVAGRYAPVKGWTFGLAGRRWLNEIDDLARGTTAADNTTRISLAGLDPDQYLRRDQLLMLCLDYALN